MYYVIIGYANHSYEGNGEPRYCSQIYDSKDSAEENIEHLPSIHRGHDMEYKVLEIDGGFDDTVW